MTARWTSQGESLTTVCCGGYSSGLLGVCGAQLQWLWVSASALLGSEEEDSPHLRKWAGVNTGSVQDTEPREALCILTRPGWEAGQGTCCPGSAAFITRPRCPVLHIVYCTSHTLSFLQITLCDRLALNKPIDAI